MCSKVVHILHEYIALKTDILYRLQAVACLITRTCFYSFFCLFCTSLLNLHNSAVCQNSNRPTDYAKQSINQVWLVPINTVVVTSYSPVMLLLFNSVGGPPPQGRATLRNCFSVCLSHMWPTSRKLSQMGIWLLWNTNRKYRSTKRSPRSVPPTPKSLVYLNTGINSNPPNTKSRRPASVPRMYGMHGCGN